MGPRDFRTHRYLPPPNASTVKVTNPSTYTYIGPIFPPTQIPQSFHTWSSQTLQGSLLPHLVPFLSFLHVHLTECGLGFYCFSIRATQETEEFDVPRWHTDDNFFDREKEKEEKMTMKTGWKLCTTLVGPGTLFLAQGIKARKILRRVKEEVTCTSLGQHACRSIRCIGCADLGKEVRARLVMRFAKEDVVQAQKGECTVFRIGGKGAVHSEPRCAEDRVFVNVVPGNEQQLRALAEKWGMEFPRAWSVGRDLDLV